MISRLRTEFAQFKARHAEMFVELDVHAFAVSGCTSSFVAHSYHPRRENLQGTYKDSTNPPTSLTALAAKRDITSIKDKLSASQDIVADAGR